MEKKEAIYMPTATVECELQTSVPEHQILLSFNNDVDTLYFEEWWNMEGQEAYAEYYHDQKNDKSNGML